MNGTEVMSNQEMLVWAGILCIMLAVLWNLPEGKG